MSSVWAQSLHDLHCPRCDTPLVEEAGRFRVLGRPEPVHVGNVGTLRCRGGHALLARSRLYAYREEQGHPATAPVPEVAFPADPPPSPTGSS